MVEELNTALSRDGRTLYAIVEYRSTVATRSETAAGSPFGPHEMIFIDGASNPGLCPGPSADHLEIIFCTVLPATMSLDLQIATRATTGDDFGPLRLIDSLQLDSVDASPYFGVPGGEVLYFGSDRSLRGRDLYYVTRPSPGEPFGDPVEVPGPELNGPENDEDPWLSDDERWMVFASDRGGTFDIYEAFR